MEIDKNLVENWVRPIALGRKNYLFAGYACGCRQCSHDLLSAHVLANSMRVHPQEWLMDILRRVETTPAEELHTLLPHLWKATRQEEQQVATRQGSMASPAYLRDPKLSPGSRQKKQEAHGSPSDPHSTGQRESQFGDVPGTHSTYLPSESLIPSQNMPQEGTNPGQGRMPKYSGKTGLFGRLLLAS